MNIKFKRCPLCGQQVPELLYDLHHSVDGMILARMKRDFPGWSENEGVCGPCLERYRALNVMKMKQCALCGQFVPELLYDLHHSVDGMILARMKRDFPGWSENDGACGPCLDRNKEISNPAAKGVRFSSSAISSVWIPKYELP